MKKNKAFIWFLTLWFLPLFTYGIVNPHSQFWSVYSAICLSFISIVIKQREASRTIKQINALEISYFQDLRAGIWRPIMKFVLVLVLIRLAFVLDTDLGGSWVLYLLIFPIVPFGVMVILDVFNPKYNRGIVVRKNHILLGVTGLSIPKSNIEWIIVNDDGNLVIALSDKEYTFKYADPKEVKERLESLIWPDEQNLEEQN